MNKEKIDLKKKMRDIECDMNLVQRIDCTKEKSAKYAKMFKNGESLPEGVYTIKYENGEICGFFTIYEPELTEEEKQRYILLKQYETINTIKKCVVFFVVLTVISLVLSVLLSA